MATGRSATAGRMGYMEPMNSMEHGKKTDCSGRKHYVDGVRNRCTIFPYIIYIIMVMDIYKKYGQ